MRRFNNTLSDYRSIFGTLKRPESTLVNDEEISYKPSIKERSNFEKVNRNEIVKGKQKVEKDPKSRLQLVAPSCSPRLEYGKDRDYIQSKIINKNSLPKSIKINSYNVSNRNKDRSVKQNQLAKNNADMNDSLMSETINTEEFSPRTQSMSFQSLPDETITKKIGTFDRNLTPHVKKLSHIKGLCSSRLTEESVDNNYKLQASLNAQFQTNHKNHETFPSKKLKKPIFMKNMMVNSACSPIKSIKSEKSEKNFLKPVLSYHDEYNLTAKKNSPNGSMKSRTESATSGPNPKKDLLDEIDEILHEESQKYVDFYKPFESRNVLLKAPSNQSMAALKSTAKWVYSNNNLLTTFPEQHNNYENDHLNKSGENMVKAIDEKVDEVERYIQETTAKIANNEMEKIKNLLKKL